MLGGPDAKFGVPPFQIVDAYARAKAAGAKRFGMHMMTGSCVMNSEYWTETVTVLLETVARVRRELGIEFEFINIGGGLGIPYRPGVPSVDVEALAAQLARVVAEQQAANGSGAKPPRLCMENGRYMTGPFGWLVARCEVVKDTYARYYGLDACMSNLMRPGMYGAYHHITIPAREADDKPRTAANVVGTLCENNDWFAKDRELPAGAAVGDLFVIHDTGAHSHSMGFQYNGKLRAPELLLREDGSVELIREREAIACLFDNTVLPADLREALPAREAAAYPYAGRAVGVKGAAGARRARFRGIRIPVLLAAATVAGVLLGRALARR